MHGAAGQQRVGTKFLKYTYIFLPAEGEQIEIIKYVRQRLGTRNYQKVEESPQVVKLPP